MHGDITCRGAIHLIQPVKQQRGHICAFPRHECPGDAWIEALEEGGRRERRVFVAPAASRTRVESTRVSHHRYAETVRRSPRDGLRLIPRSPRSAGLDSLRRSPMIIGKLDPSVGRSGPRGFARPHRRRTPGDIDASIASRSNVCGDWPNAPPGGSGTRG
jgi:hypothetical protein